MPLILAVEPDRRQAAQLTGLVRTRLGAELVLADTTVGALEAIGNRIPDLVLVPALLSPQDDEALAAALRVIAAAADVRTLTIPVFAAPGARSRDSGVLAKWRRGRTRSAQPEGCDPAVFAEQIAAYLTETLAERELAALTATDADVEPLPAADVVVAEFAGEPVAQPTAPILEVAAAEPVEVALIDAALLEAAPAEAAPVEAAPLEAVRAELEPDEIPLTFDPDPINAEMTASVDADSTISIDVGDIDLAAFLAELEAAPATSIVEDSVAVVEEPVPIVAAAIVRTEPASAPVTTTPSRMALSIGSLPTWPALEGVPAEQPLEALLAHTTPLEAPPVTAPTSERRVREPVPKPEHIEWVALVQSLRSDIERLRLEPAQAAAGVAVRRATAANTAQQSPAPVTTGRCAPPVEHEPTAQRKKKPRLKTKPVQDEWGFFDPQQCGFAALLAKLDEITDAGDEAAAQ